MNFLPLSFLALFPDIEYEFERNLLKWQETIIVILIYIIVNRWVDKKNKIDYKKNFQLFINLKITAAIVITLLFNLYYSGGDTTAYFNDARLLNKVLFTNPSLALEMFLSSGDSSEWSDNLNNGFDGFRFCSDSSTWLVCKITAIIEIFTFRSMLGTAMIFGFFSARFIWSFYETIKKIYPFSQQHLAFAILFVPNVLLWGSGIFKDTITLCLTMYSFVCLYNIFIVKSKVIVNALIFLFIVNMVFIIKSYIIVAFLGCISVWIFGLIKINSALVRLIFKPFLLALFAIMSYFAFDEFTKSFEKFSIEKVLETTKNTGQYLKSVSEGAEGSVYDIGILDPSITGMLKLAPAAINVTLFRPYLWESGKIIIFFSALESAFILFLTLFVIFKVGMLKFFFQIFRDPLLLAFFLFTILFSIFIGLSSFNFGTLVRYKIPCIPFYLIILNTIHSQRKLARIPS